MRGIFQGWTDDWKVAARMLRRSSGFAVTTIVTLAAGIALTGSALSVINTYLVRAMPYPNSERLYRTLYSRPGEPDPRGLEHVDWAGLSEVVEVADYSGLGRFVLHTENYPQEISVLECAPRAMDAIGARATLGRVFSPEEFRPGSEKVVMISDALWRERYGGRADVLGKTIRVSAATSGDPPTDYRIVGVLPPGFRYVGNYVRDPADAALPLSEPRPTHMVLLRPGVPPEFAARRISEAVRMVASEIPQNWRGVTLESVHSHYVRDVRPILIGVTMAAALVLLIAITNVSVLMLLRALRRQKETAVRVALGAEPYRVARLLFTEAGVICGVALMAGTAAMAVTLHALGPQVEARLGRPAPGGAVAINADATVIGWVAGIGVCAAICISALPLLGTRMTRLADSLRSESRAGTDRPAARRTRAVLIALEVAASAALLIGGGLMLRTLVHLMRTNLGFETQQVFRSRIQLPERTYRDAAAFNQFYDRLEDELKSMPGGSFALSTFVPFFEPGLQELHTESRGTPNVRSTMNSVGPEFFRALGIGLREGRGFTASDRLGAEPVIVVSETLARKIAPTGGSLGRKLGVGESTQDGAAPQTVWRTIVGVVNDIHQTRADENFDDAYVPFAQVPSRYASVIIRASGTSPQWLDFVRKEAATIDPEVFVGPAPALSLQNDQIMAGPRFITSVLVGFAFLAAALALLGIYSVTAYAVQQREREIAIRMAIGATPGAVMRMFIAGVARVLAVGVVCGALASFNGTRILQSQLHGVDPFDPLTVGIACGVLVVASVLATWWPTRRITGMDPILALRSE